MKKYQDYKKEIIQKNSVVFQDYDEEYSVYKLDYNLKDLSRKVQEDKHSQ